MILLIDTNVVLDILLRRVSFYESAAKVVVLSEKGYINCYVSASAVTDIFYIAQKELKNKDKAVRLLENLFKVFRIASVTEACINEALDLKWDDFEDCVQYTVGKNIFADFIVTRNVKDFTKSNIKAVSSDELLKIITEHND